MKNDTQGELRLSWSRFYRVIAVLVAVGSLGVVSSLRQDGWHGPTLSLVIFLVSMIGFLTYRFHKLRESRGVVSKIPEGPGVLYREYIGPSLPVAIWLIGTSVVAIAVIVVPALV